MSKIYVFLSCFLLLTLSAFSEDAAKEPITQYAVYFSPEDHLADQLIALINSEQKSIKAAVYCLQHRGVAKALIDAQKRGVKIEILVDRFSVKARSPMKKLAAAKIPIFVWNPPAEETNKRRKSLMHDKFCVFNNHTVWTGSFNFTMEADTRNQENALVLQNNDLAARYLKEFERLKGNGAQHFAAFLEEKNKF